MNKRIDPGVALLCLVIGAGGYFLMKWLFPNGASDNIKTLGLAIGWGGALIIAFIGLAVVYRMFNGTIDLSKLVSEADGKASISRFQLLIFTFVISLSLLIIIVSPTDGPRFPDHIPPEILGLLGISAGSYVVSRSLQNKPGDDSSNPPAGASPPTVTVQPATLTLVEGQNATLTATGTGAGSLVYEWQRSDAAGLSWQPLSSQTPSLTWAATLAENGTQIRCKVTNPAGSALSSAVPVTVAGDRG